MTNTDAFDGLMAAANPALIIVTTAVEGDKAGCLVGFHAQSSIDPRRYSVWLSKANRTYAVASRATHVGIHFLTRSDLAIAELFGTRTGDEVDKFEGTPWAYSMEGVPMLSALPRQFVGRRIDLIEPAADHACLIAEPIVAQCLGDFEPLRLSDADELQPGHEADELR